jgi:hypothetical protein
MGESVNSPVWNLLQHAWNYASTHKEVIGWAAFFGFFFWAFFDPWGADSRIRALTRRIKNKLSEQSAARLRKRITELEKAREVFALYLASDKAFYLAHFRIVILFLMLISCGGALGILGQLFPGPNYHLLGLMVYALVIALGFFAVEFSTLDTKEKIAGMLAKRDAEIANLRQKLEAMTH